ncbi:hypothetical protein KP509_30G030300 [Ceratopteris richardii]|nr:hypothetical protein KP509_30G030300 [Ceratopteris richardii]
MLQQVPWQHPGCGRNDSGYGGRRSRFKMGRNFSSNVSKSNTQKACDKQIFLPHDNDHVEERLTSSANESGFLHKVSPYSSNEHEDPRQIQTTANNTPSRSSQIHSFKASLSEENSILDGKSLKSDLCQSSSVDTKCFKPQSNPLIHSEQKQVSDENDTVEKNQRPADSKVPSHGYTRKMTRWLEDRRNKYPSPANVQRKVEERRNREDMRDCFNKRQRCDSQVNHNHSAGHYQQQKSRIDKHLDSEVQCMDKDRMECTDYEGNMSGHVSGSELHTSGTEMPLEIEDSGPIESPYQCHVSDLEKGNQDENPQCISRNILFSKESDEELPDPCVRGEIADPSFGFVLKGKRKKRKGDQSPSPGEWQKKLWFKILGPDAGKEKSYFLQCCRFIVNNDFLQGSLDSKLTHFKWAFGKEVSNDDNAPIVMMDTTENPALPAGERAMDGLGESYPVVGTVQSIHADVSALEDAQECQNSCMSASSLCSEEPQSKINEEKATPSQAISSEEELGCNREKEQLNDTTATQAEKLSSHEMSCAVSSGQASHIKSRGLIEEPSGYVVAEDKLRCGVKQQEPSQHEGIANSSTRLCTGNNVGDLHPDFQMLSQNSGTDGFVDNAEASVLFEPSCTQYERAVCSWRHGDTCDQKDGGDHLVLKHDDCFRSSSYASDIVTDPKQTALSVSNLDSQGSIPAVWEQRIADPNLSGYSKNTDDLGIGMCDNFLDEDEILQYMNFDAFDTDTGICYS